MYEITINNEHNYYDNLDMAFDLINEKFEQDYINIEFLDKELNRKFLINDIIDLTQLIEEYSF